LQFQEDGMAKDEGKDKGQGANSEMTYQQFLIHHDRLADSRVAAHENYNKSEANYEAAQENHGEVKQRYDGASDEERPQLQGEMDDADKWLQTSANNLYVRGEEREVAEDQLARFEWQHREFDDFRRSEAEKEPSLTDKIPSVEQQFEFVAQAAAIADGATDFSSPVSDMAQVVQDYAPPPEPLIYEMPAASRTAPEPPNPLERMNDAETRDPRDTKENVEEARREVETYDNAMENGRSPSPPDAPQTSGTYDVQSNYGPPGFSNEASVSLPPADAGGSVADSKFLSGPPQSYEIPNSAQYGDPTLSYNAPVSLPPTPDQRSLTDSQPPSGPEQPPAGLPPTPGQGSVADSKFAPEFAESRSGLPQTPDQQPAAAAAQPAQPSLSPTFNEAASPDR
jgi:hypothetical protein